MNVGDMRKIIEGKNDGVEILLAGYDRFTGGTDLRYTHQCVNLEHQEKVGEIWLSTEGFKK